MKTLEQEVEQILVDLLGEIDNEQAEAHCPFVLSPRLLATDLLPHICAAIRESTSYDYVGERHWMELVLAGLRSGRVA